MKAKKIAILLGIGATLMASAPNIVSFADSISHVSNVSSAHGNVIKTGVIDFSDLSYTDIMSAGTWNSNFVGTLNNGTSINIIGQNENWYEIQYNGGTAWVMKDRVNTLNEKVLGSGTIRFSELPYTDIMSQGTWNSNFVTTLNNGTSVNIVGQNENWYEIEYNNGSAWQNAWVMKSRVNTLMGKTVIKTGVIDFDELNYTDIMMEPTWNSNSAGTLNNGTSVNIVGQSGDWYEIENNGGTVWVKKERVNTLNEKVLGTGTIRFDDLSYTDIMSQGTWNSNFVGTLNNGTNVNIVGQNENWYEIEYNNGSAWQNAWVMKSRVNTLMGTSLINTGTINFSDLNYTDIMTGPTWDSGFVGTLNNGTSVDIIGQTSNWYEIKYDGGTAWVLKNRVNTSHKPVLGTGTVRFDDLDYTYVVSGPSWDSNYVATLYNGENVNIIGESGNWYEIECGNQNSWIMKSRVNTLYGSESPTNGVIDFKDLGYTDIMTNPTWDSNVITTLNNGTNVKVVGESNGWDRIEYEGGEAWVVANRVATESEWKLQQVETPAQKAQQIINYGEQFIGTPYEWGGESPSGFDCSGLVQYVFGHNGVSLPRTAAEQQECGTPVAQGDLQPGDLVFWGDPAYHVAIYIGNGQILVSPHTGTTVTTMNLYPYTNARRVL
ncbi:MAG: SH3 domain-containing protein [Clostridium sp.]